MQSNIDRMLRAVAPLVARVHEDGVDAPYPERTWAPLLVEIKEAATALSMKPIPPDLEADMRVRECQLDILSCAHAEDIPGWIARQVARTLVRRGWVKPTR